MTAPAAGLSKSELAKVVAWLQSRDMHTESSRLFLLRLHFLLGYYLALRGLSEHHPLLRSDFTIKSINGIDVVRYDPSGNSKNFQGGLGGRKHLVGEHDAAGSSFGSLWLVIGYMAGTLLGMLSMC